MPDHYKMPWLGQPFKLEQNEQIVEYATVGGVRVTGEYLDENGVTQKSWTAVISSPISHAFRFYHNTEVGNWVPLSVEEMAALRGAAVMGDVVDKATFLHAMSLINSLGDECVRLGDRILALEKAEKQRVETLAGMLEKPAPAAQIPPPAAPTNGTRPSRVAQ